MGFQGETALVTGGSRGIGRACALELARRGADVVLLYKNNTAAAEATAADIRALGRTVTLVAADLSKAPLQLELPEVQRVVLAAGIGSADAAAFIDLEDFDEVLATNLRGPLAVCQAVLPKMIKARRGALVFISSAASRGIAGASAYAASKAGLEGLARSMALELAPRNIRVNVVSPGLVETELVAPLDGPRREALIARTPLARFGRPEEVATAVVFLLSDEASYITGETLCVNGGLFM